MNKPNIYVDDDKLWIVQNWDRPGTHGPDEFSEGIIFWDADQSYKKKHWGTWTLGETKAVIEVLQEVVDKYESKPKEKTTPELIAEMPVGSVFKTANSTYAIAKYKGNVIGLTMNQTFKPENFGATERIEVIK